ncbi:TB2/DP1/HVA22-related protein [Kipferlia bialata]|uniref:TB2/DP1/HVA22-related protein n=1 Tax=Kipferlia bialata TaxID=797122 RepID=A0A9K3CZU8_9EUKA|nr:TB2/DP1/HVA22-related protein [Kipferlia bialata]|eukprot:g7996.t1
MDHFSLYNIIEIFLLLVLPAIRGFRTLKAAEQAKGEDGKADEAKTVDVQVLQDMLKQWCVVAAWLTAEFIVDPLLQWVPLFSLAKLLIVIWLLAGGSGFAYTTLQGMIEKYAVFRRIGIAIDTVTRIAGLVSSFLR